MSSFIHLLVLALFGVCCEGQLNITNGVLSALIPRRNPFLMLYNHRVPEGRRIEDTDEDVDDSFVRGLPLKVVTHGYIRSINRPEVRWIVQGYMKYQNCNVLALDWRRYTLPPYITSLGHVQTVGEYLGNFLVKLISSGLTSAGDIDMMGHSLGAHLMGIAGQVVQQRVNAKVARITGLDAAGPGFLTRPPSGRLDQSDAEFVQGIHTDYLFGFPPAYGHADMYPNRPFRTQPGCTPGPVGVICSHTRAFSYFAESIGRPNSFLARRCDSYDQFQAGNCSSAPTTHMGDNISSQARGKYFLNTNPSSPFSLT